MSLWRRVRATIASWFSVVCVVLASAPATVRADEKRWRVFDQGAEVFLAIAGSDQPDQFDLPELSCTRAMGIISVYGEAKENLRIAMAELIRTGQAPSIQMLPNVGDKIAPFVDLSFSYDGWRYRYALIAVHEAFERFKREGVLEFKLGTILVREEFNAGLENINKFFDLCGKGPFR